MTTKDVHLYMHIEMENVRQDPQGTITHGDSRIRGVLGVEEEGDYYFSLYTSLKFCTISQYCFLHKMFLILRLFLLRFAFKAALQLFVKGESSWVRKIP